MNADDQKRRLRWACFIIFPPQSKNGSRCGHSTIVEYISWNGKGNPLEKKYIFLMDV